MKKRIDLLLRAFLTSEPAEDAEYFHDKALWLKLLRAEYEENRDLREECWIAVTGVIIDPWCFDDGRARLVYDSDALPGDAKIITNEMEGLYAHALRTGAKQLKDEGLWEFIERWRKQVCIPEKSFNSATHTSLIYQTIAAWINNERINIYDPDEGTEVFSKKALKYLANYHGYRIDERFLVDLEEVKEFLLGILGVLPANLYPEHESNTRNKKNQAKQQLIPKSECQPVNSEKIKLQNAGQNTDPKGDNQLPLEEHIQKMKDDMFSLKAAADVLHARGVSDRDIAGHFGLDKSDENNLKKINKLRSGRQKSIKDVVWPYQ